MAQLNQIIAVMNGKKKRTSEVLTEAYHLLQKRELLSGLTRTYQPLSDDGEPQPDERKNAQCSVPQVISAVKASLGELLNIVATQDNANTLAKADIVVDGKVIVPGVPVTHLLFLEHQLTDLHTFVSKLPTLDPAETWAFDTNTNQFRSEPAKVNRTKKVPRVLVKYEATDKHPAQTETYAEDITIGTYTTTKFSGCIPAQDRDEMLGRVRNLQDAVKVAREKANSIEVENIKEADAILNYVFTK